MAVFRSCREAFLPRGRKLLGCRLLAWLSVLLGLAAVIAVATAGANCAISFWVPSEGYGQTNPAHPGIEDCEVADPINCATGNLAETQVDLAVHGHGPPLQFVRYYNSQLAASQTSAGPLGYGWTGSYSAKLVFTAEKTVATVTHDNGSTINFSLSEGVWASPIWTQATLTQSGENYIYTQPDRTKLEFSGSSGRLLKITDRHNISLTLTYNGSGRLASVADQSAFTRDIVFTYNASGQIEKVEDPVGRVVKYAYTSGNLASVTMPGSETPRWKFGYNGFREMTTKTNGRGYSTTTTFDTAHRATSQTDPLGRKYTLAYKETNGVDETTITKPNGEVVLEKFNEAGAPTSITRGVGTALEATSTYAYNNALRMTSTTDPNNHTTTFTYDGRGNRLTEKDPNGNETVWTYNSANELLTETTPKGQLVTITRNASGDPTAVKRSFEAQSTEDKFEYSAQGDLIKHTDPVGRIRIYVYGGLFGWGDQPVGEYSSSISSENLLRKWRYNVNGELIEQIDGRGLEPGNEEAAFATKVTWDSQGRPTTVTDPFGNTTKAAYDANGNVETITDANSHVTGYTYDSADQLVEVKAATGATTKTTFNSMGQVATRTGGTGGTREIKYDIRGRPIEAIDPLGRKTTYEYDLAGNRVKVTDPAGRATSFTYDAGDRKTKIDYSEAATADVTFAYDKNGNVIEMTDGTGTTKRSYDAFDRLIEVTNGKAEVVKYEYNQAGDTTKLTYPNGKSITRGFDSLGRLEKVVDWFGKETKFSYYRNSQLKATTFPAETGNVDEYAYDRRGEVAQITMKKGLETLASFAYTRDKVGLVEKTVQKGFPEGPEEIVYGYDAANRLTKSNSTSFSYDAANSPTMIGSDSYTYDKAGQIATASNATHTFDKLGQRTKTTPLSGPATTYAYDQAGNLLSVSRPAEGEVSEINNTFKYDGTGLRTTETNGASTYPMVWDMTQSLPLLLRKGNDYYIYGPEGLPVEQVISSGTHFFHHDQQGSTRILTGSTGSVIGTYEYSPFGALTSFSGSQSTQMGFAGQYRSHTSRLIYMRARTYDPTTAQYVTTDPLVGASSEPYSYAADNPLNQSDPSGLYPSSGPCPCPPCPEDPYSRPAYQLPPVISKASRFGFSLDFGNSSMAYWGKYFIPIGVGVVVGIVAAPGAAVLAGAVIADVAVAELAGSVLAGAIGGGYSRIVETLLDGGSLKDVDIWGGAKSSSWGGLVGDLLGKVAPIGSSKIPAALMGELYGKVYESWDK